MKAEVSFDQLQAEEAALAEKQLELLRRTKAVAAKEQYLVEKTAEIEGLMRTFLE